MRKPRKDVDISRRAVMAYLSWAGLTHDEIARAFELSKRRVGYILAQSTWPYPTIHNTWREQAHSCITGNKC